MLEALGLDSVYGDKHVADLELVGPVRNAARLQVADPRPTVLVRAARYGQTELRAIRAQQLNQRVAFVSFSGKKQIS